MKFTKRHRLLLAQRRDDTIDGGLFLLEGWHNYSLLCMSSTPTKVSAMAEPPAIFKNQSAIFEDAMRQ